jgi:hypothetical protein
VLISFPGSIAAVMSMLADNPKTLECFETLDCCVQERFVKYLQNRKFALGDGHLNYQ